jgi:hypothetical protein
MEVALHRNWACFYSNRAFAATFWWLKGLAKVVVEPPKLFEKCAAYLYVILLWFYCSTVCMARIDFKPHQKHIWDLKVKLFTKATSSFSSSARPVHNSDRDIEREKHTVDTPSKRSRIWYYIFAFRQLQRSIVSGYAEYTDQHIFVYTRSANPVQTIMTRW